MNRTFARFASDYGMVFVLFVLCGCLSWATYAEQSATGAAGGRQVAAKVLAQAAKDAKVLIVVGTSEEDAAFAASAAAQLGPAVIAIVKGQPQDLRAELQKLTEWGSRLQV